MWRQNKYIRPITLYKGLTAKISSAPVRREREHKGGNLLAEEKTSRSLASHTEEKAGRRGQGAQEEYRAQQQRGSVQYDRLVWFASVSGWACYIKHQSEHKKKGTPKEGRASRRIVRNSTKKRKKGKREGKARGFEVEGLLSVLAGVCGEQRQRQRQQ